MIERQAKLGVALIAVLLIVGLTAGCGGSESDAEAGSEIVTGPLRVIGGGIAQYRVRGEDNTIEAYGREGARAELAQAAADVHGYLVAKAEGNLQAACAFLSKTLNRRLGQEAPPAKRGSRQACAATIAAYTSPVPAADRYRESEVVAGSLRIRGDTGFLFFNAARGGEKLLMVREDGKWRIAENLTPTPAH